MAAAIQTNGHAKPLTKGRELGGLWAALAILGAVAALTYRSVDSALDTLGWVERAGTVLREIEELSSASARATTARRAYVITGDASQLRDVPELDAHLDHSVATLRASIADDSHQLRRLDRIVALTAQRLSALDGSVARRQLEGVGSETADGLTLAAQIRSVREEMVADENRLLAERDAQTRRDMARTKLVEIAGIVTSVAILLLAFGRLRQEVRRRERSEEGLRRSERFLDSIVESIPHMIFVKDAHELRFERVNRAGEELLGVPRRDLIGKSDAALFPREQAESFRAHDRETLASGVARDVPEESIQTAAGERWLHTKKVPILDENGVPRYLLGISWDITERRKEAAALKTAKEAAEAANEELETFSYSVAHDLRAPIRAIDGFSQAIQEDCGHLLDAAGTGYLERVRASTRQMSQLIDGLLGLSRLTRGEIAREDISLTKIAEESAARLRVAHPQQSVELLVQPGLDANGDARLLAAALDNLLENAWKFTSKCVEPRVEVGQRIEDGHVIFFVRDNGAGFDQAYVHKLFGAFQRLHGATEFAGTGIGLATVQRIVRRHGGRVWAEGEVGRGATFFFTFDTNAEVARWGTR